MKCLCGYDDSIVGRRVILNDNNEFVLEPPRIKTLGKFLEIGVSTYGGTSDFIYKLHGSVKVYACPSCGTLKVDI